MRKICPQCENMFEADRVNRVYCSYLCSLEVQKLSTRHVLQKRRSRKKSLTADLGADEWKKIVEYFGGKCAYCGSSGDLDQDHFIPHSKGGAYSKRNIVPACKSCNSSKGNKSPIDWLVKRAHGLVTFVRLSRYLET
jgi:5-methylcytosine-specific restriction endonuclease McrA